VPCIWSLLQNSPAGKGVPLTDVYDAATIGNELKSKRRTLDRLADHAGNRVRVSGGIVSLNYLLATGDQHEPFP